METALIFGAFKVLPPQSQHALVIPPKKESNNYIECPGAEDLTPNGVGGDVERSHRSERPELRNRVSRTLCEIERDHDAATDHAQNDKDVPTHFGEADEHGRIEAHAIDQGGLLGTQDRLEPGKESPSHRGRGVFVIGMFNLGRIDNRVTRAKEREHQGKEDREACGGG